MSDPRHVRISVRVGGELVDDVSFPVGVGTPDLIAELGDEHGQICAEAAAAGKPYLVDVEFWDGDHVRFGTDAGGMVHPIAVAFERIAERFAELRGW